MGIIVISSIHQEIKPAINQTNQKMQTSQKSMNPSLQKTTHPSIQKINESIPPKKSIHPSKTQ